MSDQPAYGIDVREMTDEEFDHYKATGECDERFRYEYDPAFVARVLDAAAGPTLGSFTSEELIEHIRQFLNARSEPPRP